MQTSITYKDAGVNILQGEALVEQIKPWAQRTLRQEVMAGIGGFGAMFEISKKYQNPVLVSGTDGVGTKLKLAFTLNQHDTIGIDLVAMSVNDILVQGAEPLFFLDYFACGKLEVEIAARVIQGIAKGCKESGCSLIGGETAEMPGMYNLGEYDLAGFAVGVVEKHKIVDGSKLKAGDVIIGLASSGFHANGYSLVRKIIEHTNLDLNAIYQENTTWGQAIMLPTQLYVKPILALLNQVQVHGMSHITGGGITDNLPRVFPNHLAAKINLNAMPRIGLFEWIKQAANLNELQMLQTFNCGVGYVVIVEAKDVFIVNQLMQQFNLKTYVLGEVVPKTKQAIYYV